MSQAGKNLPAPGSDGGGGPASGPYNKWKHLERYLLLAGGTACKCDAKILFSHDELHYAAG